MLVLCTHNSARSQMAERILRSLSGGSVEAHSRQRSKSINEFLGQTFDYVITVCDSVREVCPTFPGSPEWIHWSLPDPAEVEDAGARRRAFDNTAVELTTRFRQLLAQIQHHQADS